VRADVGLDPAKRVALEFPLARCCFARLQDGQNWFTESTACPCSSERRDRVSGALHLAAVFALLGKRWSGIVVGTLLSGPSRFTEISRQVSGISERMLSERLNELTTAGLIERRVLARPPVGVEYRLTPRGDTSPGARPTRAMGNRAPEAT
jgi:DNA-binding HxlR family transcriptional regulator